MTEEIKKLIEEEAERYADSKGIYNQHGEALLKMGFKKGANFILSKWQEAERWRKVEEELPEVKREPYHILVKSKVGYQIIAICNYGAGISDQMEYFGVTEWKPIS